MKSLISWVSPAARNTTGILTEREGESRKRKMHVEIQSPVSNSAHPLSPQMAQYPCNFSVWTFFIYQHFLFLLWFIPCNVPFPFFKRKKNQCVCTSLWRRRENREMCSCGWAGDCRGSGDRSGRRASEQQWRSSLCFNPLSPGSGKWSSG